jgi:glycosyltransferase involved in cell wall biosynthesis
MDRSDMAFTQDPGQDPGPFRVLLLSRYARMGASSRIRHHDLVRSLTKHGFEFDSVPLLPDTYLTRFYAGQSLPYGDIMRGYLRRLKAAARAGEYDVIWIEKEALPWLPWLLERIFFRRSRPAVVIDFDDFWPSRYLESSVWYRRRIGPVKFARAMRGADVVTVANTRLAELMAPLSPHANIEVIENGIDVDLYAAAGVAADAASTPEPGPLRVGWIGTPFTASAYLPSIAEGLNRLSAEGVIRVMLIGAGAAAPEVVAERASWSEATEADDVAKNDIGLMPLVGSAFDSGKSGWKLVQFMAAGRAVVASPIGFNRDIVTHGVTGYYAPKPSDFETAIRRLAADPSLRSRMGKAAQDMVIERFDKAIAVRRTAQIFRDVIEIRRRRDLRKA